MSKSFSLRVALSLFVVVVTAFPKRQADPTEVQTSSGTVKGHQASWPQDTSVIEFLGIPYAQPPVDDLRFAAPKAFQTECAAVFVADKYSQDCLQFTGGANASRDATPALQAYGFGMGGGSALDPHSYGEDCLTMNVWTKPSGQQKKAVMVWIYGGAFSTGTSNAPFYNGGRLAQDEDVVVASFNYRINIFGFPIAPGLSDQNLGLLDQRLAIEWVRDNIAGFGGDPARITIFGESAGGSSVDFYSYAWTEDPIVNGFIAQSGSAQGGTKNVTDFAAWYNVSSQVGCGGAEAGDNVQCMRAANATDIINAVGVQASGGVQGGFGPAADGKVVFADARNRSIAGNFIKRPLLIGSTDFEVGIIRGLGANGPLSFGGLSPENITDEQITVASAVAFGCPVARTANNRTSNGVPTWRYRYMAVWDNVALAPRMGAYHSSEIPIVLGTNPLRPNSAPDVPEEAELERITVHAWAEFAKDPDNGLSALGWPKYDANGDTLIRLGFNNQSANNFGPAQQYDDLCASLGG